MEARRGDLDLLGVQTLQLRQQRDQARRGLVALDEPADRHLVLRHEPLQQGRKHGGRSFHILQAGSAHNGGFSVVHGGFRAQRV